ncbi:hypothetical protein ABGB18_48910 [Nonomuraea sp. B12E4]|uniref:hypothetical protein n=1 Tax=Nonomuraea sp. B12E4 TaxID=3153564 RepID=UPI00325D26F0
MNAAAHVTAPHPEIGAREYGLYPWGRGNTYDAHGQQETSTDPEGGAVRPRLRDRAANLALMAARFSTAPHMPDKIISL